MSSKESLEQRAEEWLNEVRYESAVGRGNRGLMPHHIAQLKGPLADLLDEAIREAREATMHDAVQIAAGYANEITSPFCEEKVSVADCMIAGAKEVEQALLARLAQLREGKT